ncbi:hypothetical protein [Bosea sp. (in: a-proteobacteria)]
MEHAFGNPPEIGRRSDAEPTMNVEMLEHADEIRPHRPGEGSLLLGNGAGLVIGATSHSSGTERIVRGDQLGVARGDADDDQLRLTRYVLERNVAEAVVALRPDYDFC